ncbi:hypothetical protein [Streptomyces sp. NPDC021020]|uniref:hypothetical protein n=1 Tax=Streptomyces sp. NPDC021020 TaxID=3365109 RepID=UPI0037A6D3D5
MFTTLGAGVPACLRCAAALALAERAHLRGGRRAAQAGRPAWQSPYGPAPHRAPRDRWARSAAPLASRPVLRRGHVCGRCD